MENQGVKLFIKRFKILLFVFISVIVISVFIRMMITDAEVLPDVMFYSLLCVLAIFSSYYIWIGNVLMRSCDKIGNIKRDCDIAWCSIMVMSICLLTFMKFLF